jgi:ferredoxin
MDSKFKFISISDFGSLLSALAEDYCVVTLEGNQDYIWQELKQSFVYNRYRPITSIRQFFTPAIESVNNYFNPQEKEQKPFCIVGAKSCDLTSLIVQDYVFLEGEVDEKYAQMRKNNLIISSDCTAFKNVCFCLNLEIKPYPQKSFDLNISEAFGGYLVEIGSDKGSAVTSDFSGLFKDSSNKLFSEREYKRQEVARNLSGQLATQNIPKKETLHGLIKNGYVNALWAEEALRCVECGACIMNCPTCHCFLLFDTKNEDGYLRGRIWDGCQYKNFTRVAGGASALKFREYRLRNRYVKKFGFFYERIKTYACTGCGRCIENCPAKIDLREIFKKLSKNSSADLKLTA